VNNKFSAVTEIAPKVIAGLRP